MRRNYHIHIKVKSELVRFPTGPENERCMAEKSDFQSDRKLKLHGRKIRFSIGPEIEAAWQKSPLSHR